MRSISQARWKVYDIQINRSFSAPREILFQVWTQAVHMLRWMRPGIAAKFAEVDLRKGGKWRVGLESPHGADYAVGGEYCFILEPELLVFSLDLEEELEGHFAGHDAIITVVLESRGAGTEMTFNMNRIPSKEAQLAQTSTWSKAFDALRIYLEAEISVQPRSKGKR